MENNARLKFDLYVLSLGLLFAFFLIIVTRFPDTSFPYRDIEAWKELAMINLPSVVLLVALLYCLYAYLCLNYELKGSGNSLFKITKIEDINYEHLTFLATYVVPLISFDFGSRRQMIGLVLLLVVMGIIYIKTDLFYANPTLALLGFHIYRANLSFKAGEKKEGIILICRGRLAENREGSYIELDDRIYYVIGDKHER
jgi:hypothetical protein